MGPKENPEDAKARELERRQSLLERRRAAEQNADGLTSDVQNVYGLSGLPMLGLSGASLGAFKASTQKGTGGLKIS